MINQEQADQLIDYLIGMLRPPDIELTRTAWRSSLAFLDVDVATQALINGSQVWTFWPSWPQVMQEYASVEMRRGETASKEITNCRTCLDMGWVLAYTRFVKFGGRDDVGPFDEYAPCPECEVGRALEGRLYPRGFWQGRDTSYLRPGEESKPSEVPPEWVARWRKARAYGDKRPFPEQAVALGTDRPTTPVDDREAWVQEGEYARSGGDQA